MRRGLTLGFVLVAVSAASWGTWSLFLRPAHVPPSASAAIVFAVMALVGAPLALRDGPGRWDRTTWLLLLAYAACDGVNLAAFFGAMDHTTVALAVLTHYATPVIVALAAPYVDGVPTPGARPAALVAMAGLVIVLEPWRDLDHGAVVGAALGLLSACAYAANVFLVRRLTVRIGPGRTNAVHAALATAVALPLAVPALRALRWAQIGRVAAGGALLSGVGNVLFARGLVQIGSARAAVLTFAEPLVAVAIGALVWGEALHPVAAVGGALILGAGVHVARKAG